VLLLTVLLALEEGAPPHLAHGTSNPGTLASRRKTTSSPGKKQALLWNVLAPLQRLTPAHPQNAHLLNLRGRALDRERMHSLSRIVNPSGRYHPWK